MSELQFFGHIIDNEEVESLDGARFDVWNPWTREVWAQAAEASAADAARAVESARRAFDEGPWPRMGRVERAAMIHKLADLMEARADDLATMDATNMGKPFLQAKHDVARSVANFRFFADSQRDSTGEAYPMDSGHHTYSEFGPAGVVAAISPWNFPLMMATWKIAPAIAWGNTCIIKPSEDTPASVTLLGRLAVEAGFPPGVLNVLNGHGAPAGSSLTADDRVDRVTFTGSSVTGKAIMASAASHLAPVSLELGGKGANLVFDDADLDNAVYWAVEAIFRNSGQICLAGSRLFVQSGIYDEFMHRFVEAAEALTIGDPFDPATKFSALASKKHFDKVRGYVDSVEVQGGKILTGGVDEDGAWLVRPTIITDLPLYCPAVLRGDLRPGLRGQQVRDRGGGARARERHPLRAQRDALHREPLPGAPGGLEAASRHGVGQLLLHPRPAHAVRWRRRLGCRARGRQLLARVLHRAQGRRHADRPRVGAQPQRRRIDQ